MEFSLLLMVLKPCCQCSPPKAQMGVIQNVLEINLDSQKLFFTLFLYYVVI